MRIEKDEENSSNGRLAMRMVMEVGDLIGLVGPDPSGAIEASVIHDLQPLPESKQIEFVVPEDGWYSWAWLLPATDEHPHPQIGYVDQRAIQFLERGATIKVNETR